MRSGSSISRGSFPRRETTLRDDTAKTIVDSGKRRRFSGSFIFNQDRQCRPGTQPKRRQHANELSYEVSLERSNQIRADLPQHPEKYTMLTGDRPTGRLHLGHYFGTLKGRVELQDMGVHTNVLIADYQVITDRDSTDNI